MISLWSVRRARHILTLCVAALAVALPAEAKDYSIPWRKITGGGMMSSTGGAFAVSGTIAQAGAGRVAVASHQITGGYWAIVLRAAGDPRLQTSGSGAERVFTWFTKTPGFVLQQTTNLAGPVAWSNVSQPVTTNGSTHLVTIPAPEREGQVFYRLRKTD